MREDEHFVLIIVPKSKKLLQYLPLATEFSIGECVYGVPLLVEHFPILRDAFFQPDEIGFPLLLVLLISWNQQSQVIRNFLQRLNCREHQGHPGLAYTKISVS